jgi:hypothetical protein
VRCANEKKSLIFCKRTCERAFAFAVKRCRASFLIKFIPLRAEPFFAQRQTGKWNFHTAEAEAREGVTFFALLS